MPYITQADILPDLPTGFLVEALDDDNDGIADVDIWDAVATRATEAVDSFLSGRYATPFSAPVPPIAKEAARVFALETLYLRRGYHSDEANPWRRSATALRNKLIKIGNGDAPLTPTAEKPGGSVSIVSEPAKTSSRYGYTAV